MYRYVQWYTFILFNKSMCTYYFLVRVYAHTRIVEYVHIQCYIKIYVVRYLDYVVCEHTCIVIEYTHILQGHFKK
jgi:hypothetical protein